MQSKYSGVHNYLKSSNTLFYHFFFLIVQKLKIIFFFFLIKRFRAQYFLNEWKRREKTRGRKIGVYNNFFFLLTEKVLGIKKDILYEFDSL